MYTLLPFNLHENEESVIPSSIHDLSKGVKWVSEMRSDPIRMLYAEISFSLNSFPVI